MARNENIKSWLQRLFARAQPRTNDQPTEGFGETSTGMTTSTHRNDVTQCALVQCGMGQLPAEDLTMRLPHSHIPYPENWNRSNSHLIRDGMGQLPFDDDPLIDIKLRPDFNWASLQCMDGVQVQTALMKSFTPTSKRGDHP